MKKIKSILCGAMAFVAGSVVLSACGAKTNPNENPTQQEEQQQQETVVGTKTTITLAEAERIIVNALAIEDNQLQTQSTRGMVLHAADVSEGNRDIMEKLGKFTWNESLSNFVIKANNKEISNKNTCYGVVDYNGGSVINALINEKIIESKITSLDTYVSNNNIFTYEDYTSLEDFDSSKVMFEEYTEQGRFTVVKDYFTHDAFAILYDDNVVKETNKNDYSLTFSTSLKDAYLWTTHKSSSESEKEVAWLRYKNYFETNCSELIDACHFNVIVNFNENNEIVSIVSDMVLIQDLSQYNYDYTELTEYKIIMIKTNEPILEPDWVTEYKQAHA